MIQQMFGGVIGGYMLVAILPGVIQAANEANTTGWETAQAALFGVVGIVMVGGSVYSLAKEWGIV